MKGTGEKAKAGTLFQSVSVGGCDFPIRYVYYDDEGISYPDLPDFEAHPQYTAEGRPFTLAVTEACGLVGWGTDNCGCCEYLLREHHDDPIGVCMNPRRQARVSKETEATI